MLIQSESVCAHRVAYAPSTTLVCFAAGQGDELENACTEAEAAHVLDYTQRCRNSWPLAQLSRACLNPGTGSLQGLYLHKGSSVYCVVAADDMRMRCLPADGAPAFPGK
jgi:hypothetical protein